MKKIVAIVGMCGSGKSVASDYLVDKGWNKIYFGGVTMDELKKNNLEITPDNERMMREKLRKEYGMGAYAKVLLDDIKESLSKGDVVLDGVYSWSELEILNEEFSNLIVLSIIVDKNIRYERLSKREIRPLTYEEAKNRDLSEIKNIEKGGPISYADYFILNNGTLEEYNNNLDIVYEKIGKRM